MNADRSAVNDYGPFQLHFRCWLSANEDCNEQTNEEHIDLTGMQLCDYTPSPIVLIMLHSHLILHHLALSSQRRYISFLRYALAQAVLSSLCTVSTLHFLKFLLNLFPESPSTDLYQDKSCTPFTSFFSLSCHLYPQPSRRRLTKAS